MEVFKPFTLNIRGRLREYRRPAVMGVVNVTPDSFYAPSRAESAQELASNVEELLAEGVDIIDIGACSTRPGSEPCDEAEELRRLEWALPVVRELSTTVPVSVDTFRPAVAERAVRALGADIVNDVYGSRYADGAMAETVAGLRVPYILTHSRGDAATMQGLTDYPEGVTAGVVAELSEALQRLRLLGVADIIVDPGLGFAKTPGQCYELLRDLPAIASMTGCPVMVGASRKSMLAVLGDDADPLAGTVAVNTIALMQGAAIVRVHDVKAARTALAAVTHTLSF